MVLRLIVKNPILSVLGMCLLLFFSAGIFFNGSWFTVASIHYIFIVTTLILCDKHYLNRIKMLIIALFFFAGFMLFSEKYILLLCGEIAVLFCIFFTNKNLFYVRLFFILCLSFLLHLFYITQTPIDIRQHDLGGIIAYMLDITYNGVNIFEFNPWNMYYFFHQPLHFIVLGYTYIFQLQLWGSSLIAKEGLQYLSLFYVTASTVFAFKMFYELKFRRNILYSLIIFFAFNPILFLFSGFISDDTPVFFLEIIFLYQLIKWYKYKKTSYIIYAAVCFGLGCLTKLSILALVPAVAILFMYELIVSQNKQKILYDLSLFVVIAVPLSLLWIVRNHVLFDMQFYNIPDTSPSGQNFKYLTFFERIGDLSQLFSPFINAPYVADANMWLALIKTELFGEWNLSLLNSAVFIPAFALYLINIAIKLCALCGCFIISYNFFYRNRDFLLFFFVLVYVILCGYSFIYGMKYPFVCSSDYRLFAFLIMPELTILGILFNKKSSCLLWGGYVYAALSSLIYSLIFI